MEQSEPQLPVAVADVAARFDSAVVGEEVGLAACEMIPALSRQSDDELRHETVLAATSNVVAIMDGLVTRTPAETIVAPSVSLRWAEWLVSRGIDVSTVPWAYNFGHGRMTDALRETVTELEIAPDDRWALGDGLSRYVKAYVESVCAQMVDHFITVEERWRGGAVAARRELVGALLDGRVSDTRAVGSELGYSLDRPQLAVVVWTNADAGARPPGRALEDAARELLQRCGAEDTLVVANGQVSVWGWGSGEALDDLHATESGRLPDGLLGAVGTVSAGLEGFVHSHRDAGQARHVAGMINSRPGAVVPYRSVALTALIATDPASALRFLEAELGPLTADTDSLRRIRATLAIYFEEGMRPVRTARRLGVHQNTVAYRVAQAEEALGRPLSERRLELETALRLAEARDALRAAHPGGGSPRL